MFDIRITIGRIDYEKTMTSLFPMALSRCREIQEQNLILRLFLELGEDAVPVLLGLIGRISEAVRQELLCQCINSYRILLTDKLNESLRLNSWGKNFKIRSLRMEQTGESLALIGEGVSADYRALLASDGTQAKINEVVGMGSFGKFVGMALNKAVEVAPEETERLGLKLMQREDIKKKLLDLTQSALQKEGVEIELREISMMESDPMAIYCDDEKGWLKFSPELEAELLQALAEYLRMLVKNCVGSEPR